MPVSFKLPKAPLGGLFLWTLIALTPVWAYGAHRWLGIAIAPRPDWMAVAWMLLIAPLLEEAVFRYLLQDGIAKMLATKRHLAPSRHAAGHASNLLTSLVFAYAHPMAGTVLFQLWWMLPSLVLGELWRRYHFYGACVATHAWFNLCLWVAGAGMLAQA